MDCGKSLLGSPEHSKCLLYLQYSIMFTYVLGPNHILVNMIALLTKHFDASLPLHGELSCQATAVMVLKLFPTLAT